MVCLTKKEYIEFVKRVKSQENDKLGLVPTPKLEETLKFVLEDLFEFKKRYLKDKDNQNLTS